MSIFYMVLSFVLYLCQRTDIFNICNAHNMRFNMILQYKIKSWLNKYYYVLIKFHALLDEGDNWLILINTNREVLLKDWMKKQKDNFPNFVPFSMKNVGPNLSVSKHAGPGQLFFIKQIT